jgi:hypothetical protein
MQFSSLAILFKMLKIMSLPDNLGNKTQNRHLLIGACLLAAN